MYSDTPIYQFTFTGPFMGEEHADRMAAYVKALKKVNQTPSVIRLGTFIIFVTIRKHTVCVILFLTKLSKP